MRFIHNTDLNLPAATVAAEGKSKGNESETDTTEKQKMVDKT